jgi:hypothetical protein
MDYWLVHWSHSSPDDPVWMAYEVTDDKAVPRMIEHYADGRTDRLRVEDQGGPSLVHGDFEIELTDSDEFTTTEISAEEFERRWNKSF